MKCKRWTRQEIFFLIKHHFDYSLSEMATKIGRSRGSTLAKIHGLGYTWRRKKTGHRRLWTLGEDQFLENNYGEITTEEIARELGRTRQAVYNRLHKLHLWRYTGNFGSIAPEFHLTESETAYLAGIIDGEGSLSVAVSWKNKYPIVGVTLGIRNTDLELIRWIQQKLNSTKWHSERYRNQNLKKVYSISIGCRAHLQAVLLRIFPYLIVKRELALQILRILRLKKTKGVLHPDLLRAILKFKEQLDVRNRRTKRYTERLKQTIKNLLKDT